MRLNDWINYFETVTQVHLQTQQEGKLSVSRLAMKIVREQGVFSLYTGISASLCRQLSYSTVRFGIYEVL